MKKQILIKYDNGKKVLVPTLTEAKSFIEVLKENGHTNITYKTK
jgi:hypothetical protein